MLAFGGASTLAIGLAAQSTVSNLVAALSLYTSRAFIKGDRVQFKSMSGVYRRRWNGSGYPADEGMCLSALSTVRPASLTCAQCSLFKTLVNDRANGALIYVNNKDLATSLMVVNESLESRDKVEQLDCGDQHRADRPLQGH